MLLSTTTSERGKPATKGGNDYIKIIFTDKNHKEVYQVYFYQNNRLMVQDKKTYKTLLDTQILNTTEI